jgi:anti-repressor protein
MSNTPTIVSDLVIIDSTRNVPMTTSLKVAEVFGKEHKNTIQAIELLDCSEEFRKLNFQLSSYKPAGAKRSYPMYLMTRDGFTFLAMGFTGARAAEFKERYIAEFNRMEAELRKSRMVALPDFTNPAEAARAWADQYEKRQALEIENAKLAPKAKLYDQYMDVDGTLNLTSAAKVLGFTSGRALGMYLRETLNWLFLDTKQVIPKAHVIEKGFMTTKAWSMIDRQKSGVQGLITAKGMDYLMKHFGLNEKEAA